MTEPSGDRATKFLAAFNAIEQHLRSEMNAKDSDGMSWLARKAGERRLLTPRDANDLQEFSQLRNAISHGEYTPDLRPIADPLPETLEEIEGIRDRLLDPPTALGVLGNQQVRTVSPGDQIHEVLHIIAATNISQLPVYEGRRYVGLLTTNAIARWVAADLRTDDTLDARTVQEVLAYAESSDFAVFLPRDASARAAIDALTVPDASKRLPVVVILTEHGSASQAPLRVVGNSDLMELVKAAGA